MYKVDPLNYLSVNDAVVVTPYHWPDTDGVACAISVAEYLTRLKNITANAMISQTPQLETQWVMQKLEISLPQIDQLTNNVKLVLVDVSDPDDLPKSIIRESVVAIIDHRTYNRAAEFPNAKVQIEDVGAASTLVAERYSSSSLLPTVTSSILLYAGIASNTANFSTRSVTERDKKIAEWLKGVGENIYTLGQGYMDKFVLEMFKAKSDFQGIPLKELIGDDLSSRLQNIVGVPTAVAQLEIIGVRSLFRKRGTEIIEALKVLQVERGAGRIFMSAIDLVEKRNIFLFIRSSDIDIVNKAIDIKFDGEFYVSERVITRKELIAVLQACYL